MSRLDPVHLPARPVRSAPEQIGNAVKEWILDGTIQPGDRLPTEEQMAKMFGVSRPTVREALRELHPYALPELVAFEITDGSEPYLKWLDEAVSVLGGAAPHPPARPDRR